MKPIFDALQDLAALAAVILFAAGFYLGCELAAADLIAGRIAQ